MSLAAVVQLELDAAAALRSPRVLRLDLVERIHEPYQLRLEIARDGAAPDLGTLLGTPAAVEIALPEGGARRVEGYIDGIDLRPDVLAVTIAPRATWCAARTRHRSRSSWTRPWGRTSRRCSTPSSAR